MRSRGTLMVAAAACASLPGCAFNERGLAHVTWYQGPHGWATRTRTFGLHVVTEEGPSGAVLGWSDLTVFHPSPGRGGELVASDVAAWVDETPLQEVGEAAVPQEWRDAATGGPIAWRHEIAGLALAVGSQRGGVTVGWRSRLELAVPLDFEGVTVIDVDTKEPGDLAYGVWEKPR